MPTGISLGGASTLARFYGRALGRGGLGLAIGHQVLAPFLSSLSTSSVHAWTVFQTASSASQ